MAINYSDLYSGLVNQNLNTTAKKGYQGPQLTHAGESVKIRAYFNLADFPTETSDNYMVKICDVPYLGEIVIDGITTGTTYVEPAADGRYFVSDNGTNGNTDFISPTINDGTKTGPYRGIVCRYRNAALYYTHTTADNTVAARVTPTVVEATIRQTSGREALAEVTQTSAPAS